MLNILIFFIFIIITPPQLLAANRLEPGFNVRGTMPWHNFLSGPTTWNERDYQKYLDWMREEKLNLLVLHAYTGGHQRYVTYVDPIVKIKYRNVLPDAQFDTSLTSRWGYRPLKIENFAFGTRKTFRTAGSSSIFGSNAALSAKTLDERYENAQTLLRRVIQMAHARGIQVAIGFEFGVYPPEIFSVLPFDSYMSNLMPDPTHPASLDVLYQTIDEVLKAYPDLDQLWIWYQEHEFRMPHEPLSNALKNLLVRDGVLFTGGDQNLAFKGVWSLAYIRAARDYLRKRAQNVELVVAGWGGSSQLEGILEGLDRALPNDIIFSMLNPAWGQQSQPQYFKKLAGHRKLYVIPWLEGDYQLWHPQERVSLLREQILLARRQGVNGVIGIHWRTEDIRANFEAFAQFARNPEEAPSLREFYANHVRNTYGEAATKDLAPLLEEMDKERWFASLTSPEYLPYHPSWGRLSPELRTRYQSRLLTVSRLKLTASSSKFRKNLEWLANVYNFVLLLDQVSTSIEPAYKLRELWILKGRLGVQSADIARANQSLRSAPIEMLFKTYAARVRSRGELGVLSSLNQKLWLQYIELTSFMKQLDGA